MQVFRKPSWLLAAGQRCLSSSPSAITPVSLAFDRYAPAETSKKGPLVILHGLFGSKQNWRSLSKSLAQRMHRDVYALDLRNHGNSPHHEGITYRHYAKDISAFFEREKLEKVTLLGHSMGGKVAMAQALIEPDSLEKLIVVDISPARGKISADFAKYTHGMQKVDDAKVKSKKEADIILQKYEPSLPIRQFLLTNLVQDSKESPFRIRLPLSILLESIEDIGDFPYLPEDGVIFKKPTLFIKGSESKYINTKNIPTGQALFPQSRLETIQGVGHWVHSEKPKEFLDLVESFCAEA